MKWPFLSSSLVNFIKTSRLSDAVAFHPGENEKKTAEKSPEGNYTSGKSPSHQSAKYGMELEEKSSTG